MYLPAPTDSPLLYASIAGFATLLFVIPLYYLVIYPYFLSPLRHLPGPSSLQDNVIKGQFPAIINGEAGIPQRAWVKKFGSVIRVVGPIGIERLIFTKPEALHKILVADWVDYPRPGFMRNTLGIVAGYGLLTVTGNEHKQMRKAMNPAFSIPNLMAQTDMYYDTIYSLIDILNGELKNSPAEQGKEILMYEWMSKVTLDIICTTAFGYNSNSLRNPHNELAEAYEDLVNMQTGYNLARFIFILTIPGVPSLFKSGLFYRWRHLLGKLPHLGLAAVLVERMQKIRDISRQILDEKLEESAIPPEDMQSKRDIMSLLVRARKVEEQAEMEKRKENAAGPGSYRMTDEEMMDQVLTFLGAGHETTASGLAWTLYLLASHPDCQRRLREEVSAVFRPDETSGEIPRPDYRALKDMTWLDCVVMESLRLFPPVPMTFRKAAKTDYIDGILVPKGTMFYIPIRVVNTWKEIWGEDAEEFNPARWQNLPPKYNSQMSFLSFIAGPHACIGRTMSILEMKAILGALVAHFDFSLAYDGQLPQPTAAVTMKPKDGMPLRVRKV